MIVQYVDPLSTLLGGNKMHLGCSDGFELNHAAAILNCWIPCSLDDPRTGNHCGQRAQTTCTSRTVLLIKFVLTLHSSTVNYDPIS